MEVVSEQIITNAEAKEILERREKEEELKYLQKNTLENLRKFVTISPDKINALKGELMKIGKLRDRHVVSIVNLLPEDKDDLRVVLHKEYTLFTEDEINLILETIKRFL